MKNPLRRLTQEGDFGEGGIKAKYGFYGISIGFSPKRKQDQHKLEGGNQVASPILDEGQKS